MLQGTIDEFPLIDVLGILRARNKTGRLEIERQAGRGLIYVRLGEPYYAESSLTRSLIGQKLVDIGAITDMQLRKALDRQAESGDRLGQILLTHGVISADHIAQAVISQIKDALADLLAWEAGEFRWETGAEVEVEVPLFGGSNGSSGEGSNPLAPHVVPINPQEPDTGLDSAPAEAVVAQTDFPQGGTTMTGNEVTANPIELVPDAGQDLSHEIVDSSPEAPDDDVDRAPEQAADPVDVLDSPTTEQATEVEETEPETELEETTPEPEPVDEFDAQTEPEVVDDAEPDTEDVPETESEDEFQNAEAELPTESEDEVVDEVEDSETEPETEDVPAPESEDEVEETEPVHELDEEDGNEEDDGEDEEEGDEPVNEAEPELTPLALAAEVHTEVPEQFHVPRIIRSQPAPELDEEFEAVFEATDHASFEVEPLPESEPEAEATYLDPPPAVDPVFGVNAFTPIAPVTDFDHPTFVPDNSSADPVFDHGNFEPLPENPESPFEPVAETTDEPVDKREALHGQVEQSSDEHTDEAPEPSFEPLPEGVDEATNEALEPPYWPIAETAEQDERVDDAPETHFGPVAFDPLDEPLGEAPEPPPFRVADIADESEEHVEDLEDTPESPFAAVAEPFDFTPPEPEPVAEATDDLVPAEPEPEQIAPQIPADDPMPVALPPPPPPELAEADAVDDVPTDEEPDAEEAEPPPGPVTPESLKDIKLDRSSLVRELSDLLR